MKQAYTTGINQWEFFVLFRSACWGEFQAQLQNNTRQNATIRNNARAVCLNVTKTAPLRHTSHLRRHFWVNYTFSSNTVLNCTERWFSTRYLFVTQISICQIQLSS